MFINQKEHIHGGYSALLGYKTITQPKKIYLQVRAAASLGKELKVGQGTYVQMSNEVMRVFCAQFRVSNK